MTHLGLAHQLVSLSVGSVPWTEGRGTNLHNTTQHTSTTRLGHTQGKRLSKQCTQSCTKLNKGYNNSINGSAQVNTGLYKHTFIQDTCQHHITCTYTEFRCQLHHSALPPGTIYCIVFTSYILLCH